MRFLSCVGLVLAFSVGAAKAAIVIDGVANEPEWSIAATAVNTVTSNWTTANRLDRLRAFADNTYLYVAIEGAISGNAIVLHADTAPGGRSDLSVLNDQTGSLDSFFSSVNIITHGGFAADFGWATRQMNCSATGPDDRYGWRRLSPSDNFVWVSGAPFACSTSVCETQIPLAALALPLGAPTIRLFVRLCDPSGAYFSNQELPMDDPATPQSVNAWLTVPRPSATGIADAQAALCLYSNHPNPFNPSTTLRFDLPVGGRVKLAVYDIAGRLLHTLLDVELPTGSLEAVWDGRDSAGRGMASGSYFARLQAGGKLQTVRMSLVR